MSVIWNIMVCLCRVPTPVFIVRLAVVYYYVLSSPVLEAATIEGIKLVGDNDYVTTSSPNPYTLNCIVRNAYNDPIESVRWYKDGRLVYNWEKGSRIGQANSEISAYINVESSGQPQNLHFKKHPSFDISGNYTCEITSKEGTVKSEKFPLVVLDIPSKDFESKVSLMGDDEKEVILENENANCTLLWDFKTPAIFPRPNITCGYYSYLHDDVTNYVPAGLTMYRLSNGSWQASFDHIHIQVSEIPREKRLGCSVRIPHTSYKKVVKYQDNFNIDHLIDSEGCPGVFLDPVYRLKSTIDAGQGNCRGDIVPLSDERSLKATLRCDENEVALFMNGSVLTSWSIDLACDVTNFQWRYLNQDMTQPTTYLDPENHLPICVPISNAGSEVMRANFTLLVFFLALLHSN